MNGNKMGSCSRFVSSSVTPRIVWRIFAMSVIFLTITIFLVDRTALVKPSRENGLIVSLEVIHGERKVSTAGWLNISRVKVFSSKSYSGLSPRTATFGIIKQKFRKHVYVMRQITHHTKTMGQSKVKRVWTDEKSLQLFQNSTTLEDKTMVEDLLKAFAEIAEKNNVEYFLCCGTLLGSYRHHGMTPWDDDTDVMMNSSHKKAIKSALLFPSILILDTSTPIRWKVYFNSSHAIKGYPYKWPFLDLIFYTENTTHIWDMNKIFPDSCFRKSWIFPTISRPFWDLWLPAPRDTERVLKREFDVDLCVTPNWNHQLEKKIDEYRRVPCKMLSDRVPFVRRQTFNELNTIETLYIGNKKLNVAIVRKPQERQ